MYRYQIAVAFPGCSLTVYLPLATDKLLDRAEIDMVGKAVATGCGAEFLWTQEDR